MSQMTRGWQHYTTATIKRMLKEKRGTGEGNAYHPWLRVQDVPSHGLSSRDQGWKTAREHHVLSTLELHYLYVLEWSPVVCDIREQFPLLPLDLTLDIAKQAGIKHPCHPKTNEPVVMTTDFLVTANNASHARSVKKVADLGDQRTLDKLDLERLYWTVHGVDWGLVTEHEIPHNLALNIRLLHKSYYYLTHTTLSISDLILCIELVTDRVCARQQPLHQITSDCDMDLGLPPGTTLSVAYYLVATRQWQIDMYALLDATRPLIVHATHLQPDLCRR